MNTVVLILCGVIALLSVRDVVFHWLWWKHLGRFIIGVGEPGKVITINPAPKPKSHKARTARSRRTRTF